MQVQPNQPSIANSESVQSSIQLESPMKPYKKLYPILILLGAIALAFGGIVGLPNPVTNEQLYEWLSTKQLHPDFKVDKGIWGFRIIFKNTTAHTVKVDQKNKSIPLHQD